MTTTIEALAGDFGSVKRGLYRIAECSRNHRTLGVGILYAITIILVLTFVTRLWWEPVIKL